MGRFFRLLLASWVLSNAVTKASADPGCGCQVECPQCHHVCELSIETVKEKKHEWTVETRPICVPKPVFSLHALFKGHDACSDRSCGAEPPCGAKVRYVNVLKKKQYECEHCRYKFTPVPVPSCGCGCGSEPGR